MFDCEVEHGFSLPYSLHCSNINRHPAHWDRPRWGSDQQVTESVLKVLYNRIKALGAVFSVH